VAISREPPAAPLGERGIGALFADLAREASRLVRQEFALAKAELIDRSAQVGAGVAFCIAGGLVVFAGGLVLLAAAVLALTLVLPPWGAALAVGGMVTLVGLAILLKGRRDMAARNLVPRRTLRTLQQDAQWAKEQMR
jgi:hypothetical protein